MASAAIPNGYTLRVRTRRGSGVIVKVRDDERRSFFVRPDNGNPPFWALNEHTVITSVRSPQQF